MKRYLLLLLACLCLSSCWTDHFDMYDRLRDEDAKALETKESVLSQFEFLKSKKAFNNRDFYKKAFAAITVEQRIELFLDINRQLSEDDALIIRAKQFYNNVPQEWILAIFGPPGAKSQTVSGFETWYYPGKIFEFHQGLMVASRDS